MAERIKVKKELSTAEGLSKLADPSSQAMELAQGAKKRTADEAAKKVEEEKRTKEEERRAKARRKEEKERN